MNDETLERTAGDLPEARAQIHAAREELERALAVAESDEVRAAIARLDRIEAEVARIERSFAGRVETAAR